MKSLMKFKYINASTIDGAVSALRQYGDKAWVLAGGTAAIANAIALPYNKYKVQIAKTLVERVILACK
jgi:hypothetical protein